MPIEKISIDDFLKLAETNLVIDARSPGEFRHAHIPGAYNLALFTDEERKVVGTAYKVQGRKQAIKIGLDYFGVKMRNMVDELEAVVSRHPSPHLLVHCWRGGMRSEAIAWLMDLYGFKVYLLKGGYKKFRHYVLETFELPFKFNLLSGYTGSGKTAMLKELRKRKEFIIDLEQIAAHKGSAFGSIDQPVQPSQEMFENLLAVELRKTFAYPTWIEDESQRIGSVSIPTKLFQQMQSSPVYLIEIPFELRLANIEAAYGGLDKAKLKDAIVRIQKRLGGLETKKALQFLDENNYKDCFVILLKYYDKCYQKSIVTRNNLRPAHKTISFNEVDEIKNVNLLMETLNK